MKKGCLTLFGIGVYLLFALAIALAMVWMIIDVLNTQL